MCIRHVVSDVSFTLDDPNRVTGRTRRMMQAAVAASKGGVDVIVVVDHVHSARSLIRRGYAGGERIRFVTPDNMDHARGAVAKVFVDHALAHMMTHAAYEHMMAELRLIQAPIGGEPATEW